MVRKTETDIWTMFVEPENCVPIFFSTKVLVLTIMAMSSFGHPFHRQFLYRKASPSLLKKKHYFDSNRKFLEEMLVWVPFVGGAQPGPKSARLRKEYSRKPLQKIQGPFWKKFDRESHMFVHFIRN